MLVAAFLHRGQDWGRGARAGLIAGMAPFLFPILIETFGSPELCEQLPWFCGAGGVAAGLFLGTRRRMRNADRKAYWTAACAVALLAGAAGCWLAGAAGLAGLGLGFAAGAVPALALRPA